ncbi:MAG: biotin attachment protein, partial [Spirochaetales bacterium]|nr:biotin attachment protein [Spirochaetales bacterium]
LRFHTHETAGTSVIAYKAALDAGADGIDLSLAPVSGGTAQPDVVVMWHALRGTEYDLDIDIGRILEAEEVLKECMKDYFLPPEALTVEPMIPFSPMPGGALTANTQMMRDCGILDKYPQVIAAMGEVVGRGGFGTSVTPVSQFYFQQAFNNAVLGPWKKIVEGYGKMVLGYFGKTPTAPDPEIVKLASEQLGLPATSRSPLEINDEDPKKGIPAARSRLAAAGLPETDENLFIAATCLEKGIAFLKGEGKIGVRKRKPGQGEPAAPASATPAAAARPAPPAAAAAAPATPVLAPVPGILTRLPVREGQAVRQGEVVAVVEFMTMENDVVAPREGVVSKLFAQQGRQVAAREEIALIS